MKASLRHASAIGALLVACVSGCRHAAPPSRRYDMLGTVLVVDNARLRLVVRHGAIPGFMAAMTMPYPVRERAALDSVAVGDSIRATVVVQDVGEWLEGITVLSRAATPPAPRPPAP